MHLIRLVYASKAREGFTLADMDSILGASSIYNDVHGITGVLCYNDAYFLQCIEGSRIEVNKLYNRIATDNRHKQPAILDYAEVTERTFSEWTMGFIPPQSVSGDIIQRYSGQRAFLPFSMNGESCYRLLVDLAKMGVTRKS